MRIAIDARMMGAERTRGIGRYIQELVRAIITLAPDHRYVLVTNSAEHPFAGNPSVETVVADVPWYGLAEQIRMTSIFSRIHPDILHVPHWNAPVTYGRPFVITVHDLLLRHEPMSAKASTRGPFVRWLKQTGYRIVLASAVARARKILVPTSFVAQDVIAHYPEARGRVIVTGEGMPRVSSEQTAVNSEQGSSPFTVHRSPYLLYVGSAYPHKGLADLLTAWKIIARDHPDLRLVIAGEKDIFMRRLESRVAEEGLSRVEFRGRVADAELADLYRNAMAFVYPSRFEGFGLPPLEAIAHECPVISSDVGPLPEVLGNEGIFYFRAGDPNAILAAVQRLFADPAAARAATAKIAPALSARHDWTRCAERTLAAYGDSRFSSHA